jgi:protein phosphatase 1G
MGTQLTYLNKPNLEKDIDRGENSDYEYVGCSMQGWRTNMEDSHLAELDFDSGKHIFGVFDGHGGKEVAIWVAANLVKILKSNKKYQEKKYEEALYKSFIEIDEHLGKQISLRIT